jgi:ArsR family transcriptional regulator
MARPLIDMEALFKSLGDATRLRILGLLLTGEVCVCDIHESLKIPQPKASRHLAYLRRSGLVETRRDGLWVHYRLGKLADPVLSAVVDAVRHALAHDAAVQRDGERLQKRTGCCVPSPGDVAGAPCCSAQAELAGTAGST